VKDLVAPPEIGQGNALDDEEENLKFAGILKRVELELNDDKNVDYSYVKELMNHK